MKSEVLATSSDRADVLLTAFRKGGSFALHLVNRNGAREATLTGVPDGEWLVTESTEAAQYQQKTRLRAKGGTLRLNLPARSLVTLTSNNGPGGAAN